MFFSKDRSVLGIDIGTADIKIAQITHGTEKVLDTYGIVNLSYQLNAKESDLAVEKTVVVLSELLKRARTTTKRCVISLPNSSVFTSVIEMPIIPEGELEQALSFEAKKYVPLPPNEVALSWSIVEQNQDKKSMSVLLTAVPKHIRENYLKLFELAELELEIIEIEALALIRSLVFDIKKNHVIIDIGAKTTGINLIKGEYLQLSRSLNVGGDSITSRIAEVLNISEVRAEQFKKDFGIGETAMLPEAVKPILQTIKTEVRQLLTIYHARGVSIDQILLLGGGADLPGVVDFFRDLNTPVVLGDPLRKIAYQAAADPFLKKFSLHLPVAIGLALRG